MSTADIFSSSGFEPFADGDSSLPKDELLETNLGFSRSELRFVLGNDTAAIARLIDALCGHLERFAACSNKCRIAIAAALEEALANAIFHGNLEVSSELRERGDAEAFYQLARQRRKQPPYCDRRVAVCATFAPDSAAFIVRDEGPGFDTDTITDARDDSQLEAPCGRGVLMMRGLMDQVAFNRKGNEVRLVKQLHS